MAVQNIDILKRRKRSTRGGVLNAGRKYIYQDSVYQYGESIELSMLKSM